MYCSAKFMEGVIRTLFAITGLLLILAFGFRVSVSSFGSWAQGALFQVEGCGFMSRVCPAGAGDSVVAHMSHRLTAFILAAAQVHAALRTLGVSFNQEVDAVRGIVVCGGVCDAMLACQFVCLFVEFSLVFCYCVCWLPPGLAPSGPIHALPSTFLPCGEPTVAEICRTGWWDSEQAIESVPLLEHRDAELGAWRPEF